MAEKRKGLFVEIVEPVVDYQDVKQAISSRSPRPRGLQGRTVALIANWKPISVPFLEALAQQLAQKVELKSAFVRNPDWQFTHPERVGKIGREVDELARQCELMMSGVGD